MKKIIIGFLIMTGLMATLTSCSDKISANNNGIRHNVSYVHSDYIDFEVVEEGASYTIVYDTHTKVLYIVMSGFQQGAMTPIYNEDGSLKLYVED